MEELFEECIGAEIWCPFVTVYPTRKLSQSPYSLSPAVLKALMKLSTGKLAGRFACGVPWNSWSLAAARFIVVAKACTCRSLGVPSLHALRRQNRQVLNNVRTRNSARVLVTLLSRESPWWTNWSAILSVHYKLLLVAIHHNSPQLHSSSDSLFS